MTANEVVTMSHSPMPPVPFPSDADTHFDRPGRNSREEMAEQAARVRAVEMLTNLLDSLPGPTYLMNDHRQIVVANPATFSLVRTFGRHDDVEGLRLGEALDCVNVANGPDGCGTAPQCRHCGAGQANRRFGKQPGEYTGELRIRSGEGASEQAMTLSVHLRPLSVNGSVLGLCSLSDLTASRRREALEHIFFHDVLNTAQAVAGAADLIPVVGDAEDRDRLARIVRESAAGLIREIQAHRDLLDAEDGTLQITRGPESLSDIVSHVADLYRHSQFGQGRTIDLHPAPGDDVVATSRVHLTRCVSNLLKNALEGSAAGEHVTLSVTASVGEVAIAVHNSAVMPAAVQAQVFQRSFSTKARSGRGLGTYSTRLLVSQYLAGTVSFESIPADGTTFTIRLPR